MSLPEAKKPIRMWEMPELTNLNRRPAHSCSIPFDDEESAVSGDDSPYLMRLDGDWKFTLLKDPESTPDEFAAVDYNDSLWGSIAVPSKWTMLMTSCPDVHSDEGKDWNKLLTARYHRNQGLLES